LWSQSSKARTSVPFLGPSQDGDLGLDRAGDRFDERRGFKFLKVRGWVDHVLVNERPRIRVRRSGALPGRFRRTREREGQAHREVAVLPTAGGRTALAPCGRSRRALRRAR
jgi:hypothetical protein